MASAVQLSSPVVGSSAVPSADTCPETLHLSVTEETTLKMDDLKCSSGVNALAVLSYTAGAPSDIREVSRVSMESLG